MVLLALRWVTSPLFGSVTPGARPQTCRDITASSEINITPPDSQSEGWLAHRPSDVTPRALFLPDDKRHWTGTQCVCEPGTWRHCPPIRSWRVSDTPANTNTLTLQKLKTRWFKDERIKENKCLISDFLPVIASVRQEGGALAQRPPNRSRLRPCDGNRHDQRQNCCCSYMLRTSCCSRFPIRLWEWRPVLHWSFLFFFSGV